ncbi:MAG TPA: sulfatase-like hydrolase/transferase [Thermoguttaceae bacterium]|nr:sulfatase-like hydrolase/transferase [Thermoguttaceae bacterium]
MRKRPSRPLSALLLSFLLLSLAAAGIARPIVAAEPAAKDRPNIVLIVADDLGYGDLACYGCPDTRTPALDRLAAQGVRFTHFYANGPECTPTRTALMTGRYQHHVGGLECAIGTGNVGRYDDAIRLAERHDLGLPTSETTIVRLLKQAGYTAVGFGKWHLGYEPKFGPLEHGFDHFFGPLGGGVDYYYHCEWDGVPMLYEDQRPVRREGYLTDLITDGAVEFVRGHKGAKPFFLYLPYTAPHTPLEAPNDKPPAPPSQEDWNQGTRETYVAMVERLDWGIGRILKALDDRGLAQDTLVIFFSDNGGTKIANNGPFSGTKGGLLEGGIREPCIVRWPGVLPEGRVTEQMAISLDLSKSIVRVAGAELPKDRAFEGIDVLKYVEEGRPAEPRTLFWRARRGDSTWRAVRDGPLKYLTRRDGDRSQEHLFDLQADPGEKDDLLASRPEDAKRLERLLLEWEQRVRPSR